MLRLGGAGSKPSDFAVWQFLHFGPQRVLIYRRQRKDEPLVLNCPSVEIPLIAGKVYTTSL